MMRLSMIGRLALRAGIGVRLVAAMPSAHAERSLTDNEIELNEAKTALVAALAENAALQTKLSEADETQVLLRKQLSIANAESEVFKKQAAELKLRLEALGPEAPNAQASRLEQRLLAAVSDLKLANERAERLERALIELTESALQFQKTSTTLDAEGRMALEAGMRQANKALGANREEPNPAESAASISNGTVISVRKDLGLIVTNIGRKHGVKAGMPLTVLRSDRVIGSLTIIDVRESIAGALIQNLESVRDPVQVGDRLKVETRK